VPAPKPRSSVAAPQKTATPRFFPTVGVVAAEHGVMAENADDLAAALLSEAGWVRRVAARLVRDGSGDDIAQDAWLRALEQRPDASTTLRGWLTETLRRLAHTRARAEARRRARERGDDAAEAPGADRLLEKAELLHRIGQMVGELDEPYRTTVLLRYFEGASAAEIARRHGVPAGTVRWRLKEALDQLRARLGREVDRDRALRALAPMAGGGGLMIPTLKLAIPTLKLAAVAVVAVAGGVTFGVVHHRHAVAAATRTVAATPALAALPSMPALSAPTRDPLADLEPSADPLQRAQDAYVHGEYDDAIELAKQAQPHDAAKAWRIIGASSCFKQDAAGATAAWDALDPRGKKFIEYVCKRNDVTLPNGAPVL
jgi:RNA polymerase sigma factor (sigma-70 family)